MAINKFFQLANFMNCLELDSNGLLFNIDPRTTELEQLLITESAHLAMEKIDLTASNRKLEESRHQVQGLRSDLDGLQESI
jgi:hypothetical protein